MSFMELQIYRKGRVYSADCSKCGMTHYIHEWITDAFNDDRDAMQAGNARCPECSGTLDKDTFRDCGRQYAGRYSAPGYMDCTDWSFSPNKRTLEKELRDMYGDDDE
jgi:hypothetical protein